MDPDHDRELPRMGRRPDIQGQAVFAHRHRAGVVDTLRLRGRLQTDVPKLLRVTYAVPGRRRDRCAPTQVAYGRLCIGDALVYGYLGARISDALQDSRAYPDLRARLTRSGSSRC